MAVTYSKGFNRPRIAGVWCEWVLDRRSGSWTLHRTDTYAVVGAVDNVNRRKSFTARIGDDVLLEGARYLSPAKLAVMEELDRRWQP